MIDAGANPHVIDIDGDTWYNRYSLSNLDYTTKLPKSIYYTVKKIKDFVADQPNFYTNGVFPGTFDKLLGHGGEGSVVRGMWGNVEVAYKFVQIKFGKIKYVSDQQADLDKRLNEMTTINATNGSAILDIIGHYRYVFCQNSNKSNFLFLDNNFASKMHRIWRKN